MLLKTTQSMLFGELREPLTKGKDGRKPLMHKIFERMLSENSELTDRIVLSETNGNCLTFGQLNDRANQLAARLLGAIDKNEKIVRSSAGDRIFAVCLPPSIDLIVSLLAIFKIGSAYVPLDISYPYNRMVYILGDSNAICLLTLNSFCNTSSALVSAAQETNVSLIDLIELMNRDTNHVAAETLIANYDNETDLAVVLYTFGSTGIFTGVRLDHKTLLQKLEWQLIRFPYGSHEIGCFKTAFTFVESIPEIWGPILCGKPLQIIPKQVVQYPEKFIELLEDTKITRIFLVPSLLKSIITILNSRQRKSDNNKPLKNLKMWICSGEVLSAQLLLKFYNVLEDGTKICNIYDRSEILRDVRYATFESRAEVLDCLLEKNKCQIGTPMFNSALYLLESFKNLVEKGAILEIYVAGIHFGVGGRNYKIGQFIKNNNLNDTDTIGYVDKIVNGQLFCGLRDHCQASGYRIDLNAISYIVNKLEKVSPKDILLCEKNGESEHVQEILVFVVPKTTGVMDVIRAELTSKLAPYMKLKVIEIEQMPLSANGRVHHPKLLQVIQQQEQRICKLSK